MEITPDQIDTAFAGIDGVADQWRYGYERRTGIAAGWLVPLTSAQVEEIAARILTLQALVDPASPAAWSAPADTDRTTPACVCGLPVDHPGECA